MTTDYELQTVRATTIMRGNDAATSDEQPGATKGARCVKQACRLGAWRRRPSGGTCGHGRATEGTKLVVGRGDTQSE